MNGYWNAADYQNQAMNAFAAMQEQADRQRIMTQQEQALRAQAEAERRAQELEQQLHNDWSAAATAGTPDAWNGLFQKYPEQYKALRESMDAMGRDRKMAEVNNAMQMYAAPDLKAAEALARRRAAALRAAGNEQEARAIEDNVGAFPDVETLRATAASIIWGGAPPETAKAFFEANKQAVVTPKDVYETLEAQGKARKVGFEADREQLKFQQESSPYAQDMAERQRTADIAQSEATAQKARADAAYAETQAKIAKLKAKMEANPNSPQNREIEARIKKLNAEASTESTKARAESLKTPSDVREYVNRLNGLNSALRGPRQLAKELMDAFNTPEGKRLKAGVGAEATEYMKKLSGEQDPETRVIEMFENLKKIQKNAEATLKDAGSVSDFEQRIMALALPDTYASVGNKLDFTKRVYKAFEAAKIEAVSAAKFNQYAGTGDKGFAGVSQNDNPDIGLKKGMTLPEYVESQIAAAGIEPLPVFEQKATGERTNVMPNPRPQGGLSSEPAKAGQPKASEIMRRLKEKSMSGGK